MSHRDPFVTAAWLADHPEVLVFDCRAYFDGRVGRDEYETGHIPGAGFASLADDLAALPGPTGNCPLPDPAVFSSRARQLGIDATSIVVTYDDAGGYVAGRLWWMLDSIGVEAYVLAGGIASWPGILESGAHIDRGGGSLVVSEWPVDRFATADDVAAAKDSAVVIDARGTEPYMGDPAADGPRTGHIPGALSAPATGNLRDLQPLSGDELRERYDSFGTSCASDTTRSESRRTPR